ncbi:hypothetical protein [Natronococcus occultus]|uniref:Uncharacterized protein n=1 Tax=Natronococcus occultus SP4 TaxID=694430 RepID=L0K1R2_9EURY|nr:hypothetical protein [Natronococcus occultus]AGB38931.1 hypothetical protein Natoc_3192 [Natronococcus occultus SP4]
MEASHTHRRIPRVGGIAVASAAGRTSFEFGEDATPTADLSTLSATWRGRDPTGAVTLQ